MADRPDISRRQLITKSALGAAAMSLAGLNAKDAVAAPTNKWDDETDVLVVGYGGAGAITAIEAADAGANVLILEKNPAELHICNTNCSTGLFIGPLDADKAFQYIKACIGDTVDDEMCRVWADQTATNCAYLRKLADAVGEPSDILRISGAEFPDLPGADGIATWTLKSGPGVKMFEILDKNVKARRDIRVEFSSPARKIIRGDGGEILGIVAERNGREIAIKGRRATVLASGGYEFNEKMKRDFFFGHPRYFSGTDSNTGDGVVLAMAAGADLWHMNWAAEHYGFFYKNFPVGFNADWESTHRMIYEAERGPLASEYGDYPAEAKQAPPPTSYMIVDQYGKRFFNDSYNGHSVYMYFCYFDPLKGVYPRLPSYFIFDESVRLNGLPLSTNIRQGGVISGHAAKYKYFWSKDQSAEIEKGWIMKADSISALASAINARQGPNAIVDYPSNVRMDPTVLAASINTFNSYAKKGSDPEFGRKRLTAIERGPFYATEVWPVGPNTQGGPRFDSKGRVLDPYGKHIPRLYKAGELGSIYGERYPAGGGNLAEVLALSRIVGRNAAMESV